MKKKLFLAILPALMVLSACVGVNPRQEVKQEPLCIEDTLAHEEVFGEAKVAGNLGVRKTANPSGVLEPKIGVQWKKSDNNNDANTKIDIRYVAAISSLDVKARWARGVAMQDSNCPKKFYNDAKKPGDFYYKEATIAYETISNDGNETKATALGGGYNYFVVYTMKNIPWQEYQYSYMAAYLQILDNETDSVLKSSEVLAVNINQQHHFSFGLMEFNGYFIEGTIGGEANEFRKIDDTPDGTDHAFESGLVLNANDNFGLFKWTPTEFQYFGRYNFGGLDTFYLEDSSALSSNYSKVRASGTYALKVESDNRFKLEAEALNVNLYLNTGSWGDNQSWGNGSGERFAIYYRDGNTDTWHWDDMVAVNPDNGLTKIYSYTLDVAAHPVFILLRMKKGVPNGWNGWSEEEHFDYTGANVRVFNQTNNIDFRAYANSVLNNQITITGWNQDNYSFAPYSA